ncbi:MAG: hypothetical protein AAFZ65_08705 [Planctomycetota bacterium]
MKKLAPFLIALVGLGFVALVVQRVVDGASSWNGVLVKPTVFDERWDDGREVAFGFELHGKRAESDFELTYEWRRGDGDWELLGAGGTSYRAYGVEPVGAHRVSLARSGELQLKEHADPKALKPSLIVSGGDGEGPSRLSRLFLADYRTVRWGALLTPEGLRERAFSVKSDRRLRLPFLTLPGAVVTESATSGPLVPWGEGIEWNGGGPERIALVESSESRVGTWRVRVMDSGRPADAEIRVTLRAIDGPVDDAEALSRLWRP